MSNYNFQEVDEVYCESCGSIFYTSDLEQCCPGCERVMAESV